MSNTSAVTPYSRRQPRPVVGAGTGLAIGAAGVAAPRGGAVAAAGRCAVAVARWLTHETEADRRGRERLQATRQREALGNHRHEPLLAAGSAAPIQSVALGLRDTPSLLRTAERLGFAPARPAPRAPSPERLPVLLETRTGERLVIERTDDALVVHTAGDRQQITRLVREHTVDQTIDHFRRQGLSVESSLQRNGEVQILARGGGAAGTSTGAEVRTQVHVDGSLCVDVNEVRGERCRDIVDALASAVGGEVTATDWKDAYFDRPGEATRTRERV